MTVPVVVLLQSTQLSALTVGTVTDGSSLCPSLSLCTVAMAVAGSCGIDPAHFAVTPP